MSSPSSYDEGCEPMPAVIVCLSIRLSVQPSPECGLVYFTLPLCEQPYDLSMPSLGSYDVRCDSMPVVHVFFFFVVTVHQAS